MPFIGETIALIVAISWTATALFADEASHRLGSLALILIRMILSLTMLTLLLWVSTGTPFPSFASGSAWLWLALSGVVGYVFGDFCLFNSYIVFGSKYGQLFMTLAPPIAGITGWLFLGEEMRWTSWLAMFVTLSGIAFSIMVKQGNSVKVKLPLKGILFGIGAGMGQGVGLVLSKIGLEHYATKYPSHFINLNNHLFHIFSVTMLHVTLLHLLHHPNFLLEPSIFHPSTPFSPPS